MARNRMKSSKVPPAVDMTVSPAAKKRGVTHPGDGLGQESPDLRVPKEWQHGRIVLAHPPAKALKGRGADRIKATEVSDRSGRRLSRKLCEWYVRKLEARHKVLVSDPDSYGTKKTPHLSPEAADLLREHAAVWSQLFDHERKAAQEGEQARLESLSALTVPADFQNGKVLLPAPRQPLAKSFCWKPDFEGESYQAVLHFYGYLPAEHVGSVRDANGYPAKVMSPEAAELYRQHRAFWEAKHAESRLHARKASADRVTAANLGIRDAAASAGLSRSDLEAKLKRLSLLVEKGHLRLVASMIAGFGDAWLYKSLLAGASVDPSGDLRPGKTLRRFNERSDLVFVLAVAYMPERLKLDKSVRRDAAVVVDVDGDTVDIVAELSQRLPALKARWAPEAFEKLDLLSPQTARFLAAQGQDLSLAVREIRLEEAASLSKLKGDLDLPRLTGIDSATAEALARHKGGLTLGLTELSEDVARCLANHDGDLTFPCLASISPAAAAALVKHAGTLTLGRWDEGQFTLDATAANHLARHAGPVNLPGLKRLDSEAALALAAQSHGLDVTNIEEFPQGEGGTRLCERIAAGGPSHGHVIHLTELETLSAACASVLATSDAELNLRVKAWNDDALIALAKHRGSLVINPKHISDAVGLSLSQRGDATSLVIEEGDSASMTEGAARALRDYEGTLAFEGSVELSPAAARLLTGRKSLSLYRSKIKPSIRKVFDAAGAWQGSVWTRGQCRGKGRLNKRLR